MASIKHKELLARPINLGEKISPANIRLSRSNELKYRLNKTPNILIPQPPVIKYSQIGSNNPGSKEISLSTPNHINLDSTKN